MPDVADKVLLGLVLFTIHVRCRFSDAQKVDSEPRFEPEENGMDIFECVSHRPKTNRKTSGVVVPVPLVAFANGISGKPWGEAWLTCRLRWGLAGRPLMPHFDGESFQSKDMSTTIATCWLKDIMVQPKTLKCEQVPCVTLLTDAAAESDGDGVNSRVSIGGVLVTFEGTVDY
eukprot:405116-Amphidinium_carterae.1